MSEVTESRELSPDEWRSLLDPFGYADVMTMTPAVRFTVPRDILRHEIRILLRGSPDAELGEWAERRYLLEQAEQAIGAVRDAGFWLPDAPEITFGGDYLYRLGETRPSWVAQAELRFTCGRASR